MVLQVWRFLGSLNRAIPHCLITITIFGRVASHKLLNNIHLVRPYDSSNWRIKVWGSRIESTRSLNKEMNGLTKIQAMKWWNCFIEWSHSSVNTNVQFMSSIMNPPTWILIGSLIRFVVNTLMHFPINSIPINKYPFQWTHDLGARPFQNLLRPFNLLLMAKGESGTTSIPSQW
jgi:hypothetical protein